MSVWRVKEMGGMIPAVDKRLLPDSAASFTENGLLKSGSLIPLPEYQTLHTLAPGSSYAYRLPANYADAQFLFASTYMEFDDPDTSVIRAPTIGDTHDRFYFVSPEIPAKYNTRARIEAGQPPFLLGVPAPTIAPIVAPVGGVSATLVTRAYVYTYVTRYNEEGPPSPPTKATDKVDATWGITCTAPLTTDMQPPLGAGPDRDITKIRIYRTILGTDGVTQYYLVTELDLPTVAYNDILTDDVVSLNSILVSQSWSGPPDDLFGFVLMPNGFIAGWRGNQFSEVWFSDPFHPHAWPAEWVQTVEYPIVGLGITNQSLVCCTEGYPVTLQGTHPQYMQVNKLVNHEPCLSRGSILSGPEGVFYASPNGLILVVPGLAENITKGIIGKKDWQQLLQVPRLRAARLGMQYFAYGAVQVGVFQTGEPTPPPGYDAFQDKGPPGDEANPAYDAFMTEDLTGALIGVVIDPTSDTVAFSMLRSEFPIDNCYNDVWSGEVLLITDGKVKMLDIVTPGLQFQTTKWRSKIWQNSELRNVAACKVYFDDVYNPAVTSGEDRGVIRFFADNVMVWERPLAKSGELMRLPSGYKATYYEFEIETTWRIHSVEFATSVKELAAV
jgi:hypothetical protein